jgi:hypothetical protein
LKKLNQIVAKIYIQIGSPLPAYPISVDPSAPQQEQQHPVR